MQGKIMFVLGAATGYVLGTRQGREGYERLKSQVSNFWQNPRVQQTVGDVQDFAKDKAPLVGEKVSEVAGKVTGAARGKKSATSTGSNATSSTGRASTGTATPTPATVIPTANTTATSVDNA